MSRLTKEQTELVWKFFKETGFIRQTAKKAGVSRKAVRRLLGQGPFNAPVSHPRLSKLNPYKAKIGLLVREQNLSAVRVLEEIQELGYDGKYTILKDYILSDQPPTENPGPPLTIPREKNGRWTGVPIRSSWEDDEPLYKPVQLYCALADGFITAISQIKPLKAS